MGKHERRSLEEIENRLIAEDPDFARGMSEGRPRLMRWRVRQVPPLLALAGVAIALAAVLLVLAEFGAALLAAVLAGAVIALRRWRLEA